MSEQPTPKRKGVLLKGLTLLGAEGVADGYVYLPAELADTIPRDVIEPHIVGPDPDDPPAA